MAGGLPSGFVFWFLCFVSTPALLFSTWVSFWYLKHPSPVIVIIADLITVFIGTVWIPLVISLLVSKLFDEWIVKWFKNVGLGGKPEVLFNSIQQLVLHFGVRRPLIPTAAIVVTAAMLLFLFAMVATQNLLTDYISRLIGVSIIMGIHLVKERVKWLPFVLIGISFIVLMCRKPAAEDDEERCE